MVRRPLSKRPSLPPDMAETQYRIVQTAASTFIIEKLRCFTTPARWPWSASLPGHEWVPAVRIPGQPRPFRSQEAAQKWINDTRTYPIVVKESA